MADGLSLAGKSHAGLLQEHEDKGQLSTIRLASVGASTGCLARSQSTRSHKSSFVQKDVDSNAPTLLSAADINATLHALRYCCRRWCSGNGQSCLASARSHQLYFHICT